MVITLFILGALAVILGTLLICYRDRLGEASERAADSVLPGFLARTAKIDAFGLEMSERFVVGGIGAILVGALVAVISFFV